MTPKHWESVCNIMLGAFLASSAMVLTFVAKEIQQNQGDKRAR